MAACTWFEGTEGRRRKRLDNDNQGVEIKTVKKDRQIVEAIKAIKQSRGTGRTGCIGA